MSEIKVNSIKGVGATNAAITVNNTDGTCTANITNNLSNRNLIINGAMQLAQRGTSSTSSGYQTVDRIIHTGTGWDAAMTQSQSDVASGTTPYTLGFRKAFKVQNGNQTRDPAASELGIRYSIEAQDVANSGWNYTSASSFITLSFWVKSSVAQNFYGYLLTLDGTMQRYAFETGSLTADTWTKVTKTIPGNSNITIDNDINEGFRIEWRVFQGTDFTASGTALNTWAAFASGTRAPDQATTWFSTNNATFEITGVQLEVGSVATDFEHRSFGDELLKCQRYYYKNTVNNNEHFNGMAMADVDGNSIELSSPFPTTMRNAPSALEQTGTASDYKIRRSSTQTCTSVPTFGSATTDQLQCRFTKSSHGYGDGSAVRCIGGGSGVYLAVSAEL